MPLLRRAAFLTSALFIGLSPLSAAAQVADASGSATLTALWDTARAGDFPKLNAELAAIDKGSGPVASAASTLAQHIAQRETDRAARIVEVNKDFDKALATQPTTDISISKALRAMIELHMISLDKETVLAAPKTVALVKQADAAAKAAEARGDAVAAGELFVLLDALLDVQGTYKDDVRRIVQRQEMLRLYVPEKLYNQRLARSKAMGDDDLPPYNAFGDGYKVKTEGIDESLIFRAIAKARLHVEQRPVNTLLAGGLEAIRTMVTTGDLAAAFPNLADDGRRNQMLGFLDKELSDLRARASKPGGGQLDPVQIEGLVKRVLDQNDSTVSVPHPAMLHEFGNGIMSQLDEFSAIIWPDEVNRFAKSTKGEFVGIGVQIEYDELLNIRVVTALEGTPAQKAGIHPKDVIKAVDGNNMLGLSLDQAVEVITGPKGTKVHLTLERPLEEVPAGALSPDAKNDSPAEIKPESKDPEVDRKAAVARAKALKKKIVEVTVPRSLISVASVKGWKRQGIREDAWDYFIDKDNGIGYVRLLQFSRNSTDEFDRAIAEMKKQGLKALVFDLRYNPGGLLDQAAKIARRFIKTPDGVIVSTKGPGSTPDAEMTQPSRASLADIPVVVLINEGSASASEIVSGALSTYAHQNQVDAVILGARSYGKGSVQNVWDITADAGMKVTTAYYMLPDRRIIHRRPGAKTWGVEPDLKVEMLPKQSEKTLNIRRNADAALDATMTRLRNAGGPGELSRATGVLDRLGTAGFLLANGGAAKKRLVELGRPAAEVEKMPAAQAVLLRAKVEWQAGNDDAAVCFALPYPDAVTVMGRLKARAKAATTTTDPLVRLFALTAPAMEKVHEAHSRTERRMAGLRAVEAVRLHAAATGGKWPATLAEVTRVPVPADPITGKPFAYAVSGPTFTLTAPPPAGDPPHPGNNFRYEVTLRP